MPQYYDPDSGKPIASAQPTAKQYYDPNTGQPVQSEQSPAQQPGFLENLGHTFGIGKDEINASQKQFQDHPIRSIAEAALGPAYQAGKGLVGGVARSAGEIGQAVSALHNGNPASAALHGITALPVIGPALNKMADEAPATSPGQSYMDRVFSAATPGNIGTALGTAAQVAPMVLGAVDYAMPGRSLIAPIKPSIQNLHPTSSSSVVLPGEMASRKLSAAVLPATKDASSFIKAAPDEVPNILAHAKETGNPLKTQLEFSKAAEGNAQNARNFYENQVLKPNDKMVRTSGTGFGRQTGEGPDTYASLTDIDKRIVNINKQLDKPTLNADDARKALATKTDLQTEAGKLRDLLHTHLSQATGIAPEDIANLRQRVGRSYELAHDTDAAVTARMQAAGKADQGPLHLSQIPGRMLEAVWGGPVAIADRQFQRAVRNFPGEAQPLPTVNPPAPSIPGTPRPSLASTLGIEAEPNPLHAEPMNPENARAQVSTMNRSLARRGANIEDQNAARNAAASERANRLESLLRPAKEKQTVAPATRKQ